MNHSNLQRVIDKLGMAQEASALETAVDYSDCVTNVGHVIRFFQNSKCVCSAAGAACRYAKAFREWNDVNNYPPNAIHDCLTGNLVCGRDKWKANCCRGVVFLAGTNCGKSFYTLDALQEIFAGWVYKIPREGNFKLASLLKKPREFLFDEMSGDRIRGSKGWGL